MHKNDWNDFIGDVNWFVKKDDVVQVRNIKEVFFTATDEFKRTFPILIQLLYLARVTEIKVNNRLYYLYGWTNKYGQSMGWLCPPPGLKNKMNILHPEHKILISCFGGIKEIWNEPDDTWLQNLNSALCEEECGIGFGELNRYFTEICEEEGINPMIDLKAYISFAFEANGNRTAYHKSTGRIVMFAPNHCYEHISCFDNCPEHTLYTIDECEDIKLWVEKVACQWMDEL